MNHFFFALFSSATILVGSAAALATGGTSSGGSEYMTIESNPWFIGARPVSYCVQIDHSGFSADEAAVDRALGEVFAKWSATLAALKPDATPTDVLDGQPKNLTTTFAKEACTATTDLRFVLGAHTPEIRRILREHARYTFGFAQSTTYDEQTGRSRGVVWLAADIGPNAYTGPSAGASFWSQGATIYNVLLHEMGHVFGFAHTETGIMYANAPLWAILGGTETRYATIGLVMQHWRKTGVPVCGWVASDGEEMLTLLLGANHGWPIRGCFNPQPNGNFHLSISNQLGASTSIDLTSSGQWPVTTPSTDSISGNYRRAQPVRGETFQWPWQHAFVLDDSKDELVNGSFNGKDVAMILQTNRNQLRFVVKTPDSASFHYFYLEYPLTD